MSGVSDGQLANQTNFNNAFMARNGNTDTVGQVDLLNADAPSGASVLNIQRAINSLCSSLGITNAEAYNALISWASTIVGTSSSSSKDKIEALVERFSGTTGHSHDGSDGNAPPVSAEDLSDFNDFWLVWQSFNRTSVTGGSIDVTVEMAGKVAGGGSATEGVLTTGGENRCELIDSATNTFLEDAEGQRIYAKITESGGTWTLTFFKFEGGSEVGHTFSSGVDMGVLFREVFRSANRPTIGTNPMEFGTLDVTADVTDATELLKGKVALANAAPPAIASTGAKGTSDRAAKADHTHEGLHSIAKSGDSQILGDATLSAGSNITLTQAGNNIEISAAATASPLTTKGDLYTHDGSANARLPIGANDKALIADSSQATGQRWGELPIAGGGTGASTKAAGFDALSPMTTGGDLIYGGASGTGTRLANGTAGQFLKSSGGTSAPTWSFRTPPTVQNFTSGGAFTWNRPSGCTKVIIVAIGPGGGGAGSATIAGANGGNGQSSASNTTVSSFITAFTGTGGGATGGSGGAGGSYSVSSGILLFGFIGGAGQFGLTSNTATVNPAFGGGGGAGMGGGAGQANAQPGGTNTGGGGAGSGGGQPLFGGSGGGGGGGCVVLVDSPASSYSGNVGPGGAGGAAGTGGGGGGAGGSGKVTFIEFYD